MRLATALLAAWIMSVAWSFVPPVDKAGDVTVSISDPGEIEQLGKPLEITVTVENGAQAEAKGVVRLEGIDDWQVKPADQAFAVSPGGRSVLTFSVTPSPRSYAVHYPIHAYATFTVAGRQYTAHPILIVTVSPKCGYHESWADPQQGATRLTGAALRLEDCRQCQMTLQTHGRPPVVFPWGQLGSDQDTGGHVARYSQVDRGGVKDALGMHEPWRQGWGSVWVDYPVVLPNRPCRLVFWTAIRDHNPDREPPSDGVDFRIYVAPAGSEQFEQVFQRFTDSKRWELAEVDLSRYAGRQIVLRLWQGPGPKNDTTCDMAYWGEPTLLVGQAKPGADARTGADLRQKAISLARNALSGRRGAYSWVLQSRAGRFGVGLALGTLGIVDGAVAFVSSKGELVFDGFRIAVDGNRLGSWRSEVAVDRVAVSSRGDGLTVTYSLAHRGRSYQAQVRVWPERGGLRLAFSMPGVARAADGTPRFTELSLGPASQPVRRLYCGFGNVMVPKGPVTLNASGFVLSTRHAGADFAGGLSLVQASDIFPDRFEWRPEEQRCSLVAHHDATITLVPSEAGAFAAARVFRDIAGYKPSPGYKNIVGRMCIDKWGGRYADDAADLRRAAAYGLNDAVFIKHVWQRWGYDYRLPDIYPPGQYNGTFDEFLAMINAAKEAGMRVGVHDNYIDFYPDATGFSYRHIIFNPDGRPQRAWYNAGAKAQSYRWLPHAFTPWLERNLKLIRDGFAPTAYFIDVFSAIPPLDYYEQSGRFHTKQECAEAWGRAFDRVREILGGDAPMVSEAGHDGLIGHLDAGQADHFEATRWTNQLEDFERVPWHDMATHGSFVLLAGGLGSRYSNGQPAHGYGTDDYLSNTVIGGRNPMCDGPCYRNTVITYWLLHDVCARLARAGLESVEFVDDNIHRLHSTFSDGGEVWVNRGQEPWQVANVTLPQYGFLARSGDCRAEIILRDGIPARMAQSPGVIFVDPRAPYLDTSGRVNVTTYVTGGRIEDNRLILDVLWEIRQPLPEGEVIFVHLCHPEADHPEKIAAYGRCDLPAEKLQQPGTYQAHIIWEVPQDAPAGDWYVRYGLYNPKLGGRRAIPLAPLDGSRVMGGDVVVRKVDGRAALAEYKPAPVRIGTEAPNAEAKVIDFGP
ncbi:MAG: hypothetical protein H5T86_06860, partial [Armatimonadetes bacterium]|nr:hypothetical protein [Armatimonadota bacterium]